MKKDRAKVDIFMPIFIGDYLGDTMHLGAEGHGAYLLLLMHAWRHDGRLPSGQEELMAIAHVRPGRWRQVWGTIARYFEINGDALVSRRLNKELARANGRIKAESEGGKRGAQKRWGGNAEPSGEFIAPPLGTPSQPHALKNATSEITSQKIPSEGDPPLPPKLPAVDPLTVNGLIAIVTAEVERAQPQIGLYQPGHWARKSAEAFHAAIPERLRNDVTRAEIRRRVKAFASSSDKRVTRGTWLVEHFCEAYNELSQKTPERDAVIDAAVAKTGSLPYLPPEKGVARGAG